MHLRTFIVALFVFINSLALADNRHQCVIAGTEATEVRVVTPFDTRFHVALADGTGKNFHMRQYPGLASPAVAGPSAHDVWFFFADGIVRYSTDDGSVLASYDFPEPEPLERRLSAELVINRDGTRLALWILDHDLHCRVRIFDAATLQLLQTPGDAILGSELGRFAMTFSPDGAYADVHNFHTPELIRWSTTSNNAPTSYALPNPGGNFTYLNGQPAVAARHSEVAVHSVHNHECSHSPIPSFGVCGSVDYTSTETLILAPLVGAPVILGTSTREVVGETFSSEDGTVPPTTGTWNYQLPCTLDGQVGPAQPFESDPQPYENDPLNFDHTLWARTTVHDTTVYRMVSGSVLQVYISPVPLDPSAVQGWMVE